MVANLKKSNYSCYQTSKTKKCRLLVHQL